MEKAKRIHKRLTLHVNKEVDVYAIKSNPAYIHWVSDYVASGVLNNSATAKRLEGFVNAPFVTSGVTEEILQEQGKIFNSPDASLTLTFNDQSNKADFLTILEEVKEKDLYPNEAFRNWAKDPCGFYVMEPAPENSNIPNAYWVPSSSVISPCIETTAISGRQYVKWLYYKYETNVIDGECYMYVDDEAFYLISGDDIKGMYPHGLGYAPVHQIGDAPINDSKYLKGNTITTLFDDLDYYATWSYSRRYNETGNAWPYWITTRRNCNHQQQVIDEEATVWGYCNNGHIHYDGKDTGTVCSLCNGQSQPGAFVVGTQMELEPSGAGQGESPIKPSEAVHKVGPESTSLDYGGSREEGLRRQILARALGNTELVNDQAVNEMQASGVFSSAQAKLNEIKSVFESLREWWVRSMAIYMYDGSFVDVSYKMGTRNFLYTEMELLAVKEKAIQAGASRFALQAIDSLIDESIANKTGTVSRNEILRHIDPLGGKRYDPEVDGGLLNDEERVLTQRLEVLIRKWERDNNIDIQQFMPNSSMSMRVQAITDQLIEYIKRPPQESQN